MQYKQSFLTKKGLPFRKGPVRWVALILLSLAAMGQTYSFNIPQATQDAFEQQLGIDTFQFDLLYTYYALPSVLTTLILGAAMDIVGLRVGVLATCIGLSFGQFIVCIGVQVSTFWVVLMGRIVAGIAAESLMTGQTALACYWFQGLQLALAVGIANTLPQLGDTLNSYLTPLIYNASNSVAICQWMGQVMCIVSAAFGLIIFILDKKADQYDAQNGLHKALQQQQPAPSCSDLKQMPLAFWVTISTLALTIGGFIPFMDNANSYYVQRFCFTNVEAGRATMITYLTSIALAIPFGCIIDKVGCRRYWIVLNTVVLFSAHLFMWVYPSCNGNTQYAAVIGLFLMGVAFCLYTTSLLPCPSKMVRQRFLGTAYGIEAMISALAMGLIPIFSSLIQEGAGQQAGQKYQSLMFTCLALINIGIAISLFFIDKQNSDLLDLTDVQLEMKQKENVKAITNIQITNIDKQKI